MSVQVGDVAPDFSLQSSRGFNMPMSLSEFRGRPILLVFVPMAFSPVCDAEYCALRDDMEAYKQADAQVVGVSVDSLWALQAWGEQRGFDFPLLSDYQPRGAVARLYGVFNEEAGFANRATFVIDADGIVRDIFRADVPKERNPQDYRQALARL